ncbi:hypothetical protein GUITHDRAFT_152295, partial [Guillardia theta CCMP2712]
MKEEVATSLYVNYDPEISTNPIYRRVQDAPGFAHTLERHKVVKPYIERFIRSQLRTKKRIELELAVRYRIYQKDWLKRNHLPKVKKQSKELHAIMYPAEQEEEEMPQRKTRSRDTVRSEAEFQELLGAMEQEQKRQKGLAIIPPMLVTPEERQAYVFKSTNLMSVDSFSEEYNRAFINTWTDEEKQIFLEKLADFAGRPDREGLKKNFYKLSHYLPNKTTRDCIKYYYLQKTSKSFKDAYKKL